MKPIIIQLVTWNGAKYIPFLFKSLREQKFVDWELFVLDNGSTDGTVALITEELRSLKQKATLIEKKENIGFAPGHNELFRQSISQAKYVVLLNQDMNLNSDFLDKLFYFAESHSDVGAVSGRLMKWAFPEKTNIIDSLGICAFKNHRFVDMNGGIVWDSVDDDVEAVEVFGVSGALPMYRSEALQDVVLEGEVFDEDFFSYKEDVDLAWRLRIAGWTAFSVMDAVTFHDRSASGPSDLSDTSAIKNRKKKSGLANFYSYRNHILMLIKNYHCAGGASVFLQIMWYELKKAVYLCITDTKVFFGGWRDIIRLYSRMCYKRGIIESKRRASLYELEEWFK